MADGISLSRGIMDGLTITNTILSMKREREEMDAEREMKGREYGLRVRQLEQQIQKNDMLMTDRRHRQQALDSLAAMFAGSQDPERLKDVTMAHINTVGAISSGADFDEAGMMLAADGSMHHIDDLTLSPDGDLIAAKITDNPGKANAKTRHMQMPVPALMSEMAAQRQAWGNVAALMIQSGNVDAAIDVMKFQHKINNPDAPDMSDEEMFYRTLKREGASTEDAISQTVRIFHGDKGDAAVSSNVQMLRELMGLGFTVEESLPWIGGGRGGTGTGMTAAGKDARDEEVQAAETEKHIRKLSGEISSDPEKIHAFEIRNGFEEGTAKTEDVIKALRKAYMKEEEEPAAAAAPAQAEEPPAEATGDATTLGGGGEGYAAVVGQAKPTRENAVTMFEKAYGGDDSKAVTDDGLLARDVAALELLQERIGAEVKREQDGTLLLVIREDGKPRAFRLTEDMLDAIRRAR